MAYRVGSDKAGSGTRKCLDKIIEVLKNGGQNEVVDLGITPNLEHKLGEGSGDDIGVFVVNGVCLGTMVSCYLGQVKSGKVKEIYFCIPQETYGGHLIKSANDIQSKKVPITNDGTHWNKMAYEWDGKYTTQEICDNLQGINYAYGQTCEEAAQQVLAGGGAQPGGGTGEETGSGSGGAAIKDKTFEDCIRRICAATDSVFMVENNAAIMFPYTDWMAFTLRQKMKKINAKMIDRELYEMEYTTDGYYNKVTTVYGAKEDTTKDDEDKTPTGNSKKDKDKNKQNQNDNTTDKQTNGNITQERKSMPTGGTLLSQQYDPLVKKYGEIEKKVTTNFPNEETALYVSNALLIQYVREFNNSCRFRMLNNQKLIGGTFYQVQDPFSKEKELYYLNSYTIGQKNKEPITTDVEFKYGPEGAEEVMDYQRYSGTGGGSTGITGDGSATEQQIWADAAKVKYCHCNSTQDPETAYKQLSGKEDQSKTDCYGMSAYLYYRFNNQAGIPCRVIGNSTHHVVTLYKNNAWYEPRSEYKQLDHCFQYITHGQCTDVLLEPPNNPSSSASGNTGDQNNNGTGNDGSDKQNSKSKKNETINSTRIMTGLGVTT